MYTILHYKKKKTLPEAGYELEMQLKFNRHFLYQLFEQLSHLEIILL